MPHNNLSDALLSLSEPLCFVLPYRTLRACVSKGMGAFLSTVEKTNWDSDNGCVHKIYTMSKMSG